jgi:hypothetical protein
LSRPNTEKPQVAASRLSSFHSQTRTGTVIGRPPRKPILAGSQLRFPLPARIAPPRWGTRGLRCECSLPSARRERFRELVWPADFTWPWKSLRLSWPTPIRASPNLPGEFPDSARVHTHLRQRSCEPFKDIKKAQWSQRSNMDQGGFAGTDY